MKKLIIAGAASVAMAAMPVVGVFAEDPAALTDTLKITVNDSCSFDRDSGGSAEFQKTMEAAQVDTNFGSNTFTSKCNNGKGYTVKADFTSIAPTGTSTGTAITYGTTTPDSTHLGIWTAYKSTETAGNIENGTNVLNTSSADPAGGTSFSVTYKVGLHDNQEQGNYQGTAKYTLTQKS